MNPYPKRTCGTCRFFDGVDDGHGFCRVHAPMARGPFHDGTWPKVTANEWCGEWGEIPYPTTTVRPPNPFGVS